MCGIFGYIGARNAGETVIEGLKKLEYRGYDSAGYSVYDKQEDKIVMVKSAGRVSVLPPPPLYSNIGVGHTRWATHGAPSTVNAHPHLSQDGKFAVVHNGIIENEEALRAELKMQGVNFVSETDSEIIAQLLALNYKGDIRVAVEETAARLKGAYTFLALSTYERAIYGYRHNASLIIGLGEGESFVASDAVALCGYAAEGMILEDDELAVLTGECCKVYKYGRLLEKKIFKISQSELCGDYANFMHKEIEEIPEAMLSAAAGLYSPEGLKKMPDEILKEVTSIHISACGTAYNAGLYGKHVLERLTGIPVEVQIASEVRDNALFFGPERLALFISQSGETCDTLSALKIAKAMGSFTLAVTNVRGSSITFAADYTLYTDAGAEKAVAATKSYNAQLVALYLFAHYIAVKRGKGQAETEDVLKLKVADLAVQARKLICSGQGEKLAERYKGCFSSFYVGKGVDYPTALEGALKLKEITYKKTDAYPAGELKHGAIALIDQTALAIAVCTSEDNLKIKNSIKELTARGARIIAVSVKEFDGADNIILPAVSDPLLRPMLSVIPLQKFALATADLLGLDADKPRNLAKSVTVE